MAKHSHKHINHASKHSADDLKKSSDSEEINVDFKKITNFFSNKNLFNSTTLIILLLIICVFASVFFRAYPSTLPISEDWARSGIYSNIKNNIAAQVNQQYPNLPAANKNQLIDEQFANVLEQQGKEIEDAVKSNSLGLKSRLQDDNGQTYLLAIDPYFYYRYVRNKIEKGTFYDEMRDGVPYDNHMFYPIGAPYEVSFHVQFSYYVYKFVSIFNPKVPPMNVFFFIPIIISALAVIPAFFITKKRAGLLGGFVAGMIVAVHTAFIGRTSGGFSDTDAYVVFFPLLITWLFLEGFESKNLIKKIILVLLAGLFTGIFSLAWLGWWYVFDIILGLSIVYVGYLLIKLFVNKVSWKKIFSNKNLRNTILLVAIFVISSAIFVPLFSNDTLGDAIKDPITRARFLKFATNTDYWPNIQTTVAELNPSSIPTTVSQIGGAFLFFIAALGVILTMVKANELKKKDYFFIGISAIFLGVMVTNSILRLSPITYLILLIVPMVVGLLLLLKDEREIDIKYAIFLMLWFVGAIYASTKGTRFVLLLVPAFAIGFGIALGMVHRILTRLISQEFKIKKVIVSIVIIVLLLFFLVKPISQADAVAKQEVPSMNDAWWASLEGIKMNSSEDAVINSWWDFGHWFKAIADRGVTFDGGGQHSHIAHWIGRALLTSDEEEAISILRMLDCGSFNAHYMILDEVEDPLLAVNLTKTIIMQTEEEAKQTLQDAGIDNDAITEILELTHCEPPEDFFITSEDMVGKAGVWSHFGSWDFERSFIYLNSRQLKAEKAIPLFEKELGMTEDEATDYYYQVEALSSEEEGNAWVAPWPNYFVNKWKGCQMQTIGAEPATDLNGTNNSTVVGGQEFLVCPFNQVINRNNNNNIVLEAAMFNLDNPENSTLLIGAYDMNTNYKTGGGNAIPNAFVIYDEDVKKYEMKETTFPFDVVIDKVNKRAIITDPLLSESMFTKLFYLNGKYNDHFEMFSDMTSVNNQRIIVWKVKWD